MTGSPDSRFADVGNDIQLHYYDVGEGPSVLFLHGSGPGASSYSNFKGNFPELVKHGMRVLLPDLPGYGRSSKPSSVKYTLTFMADSIKRLLDHAGVEDLSIVGNSLGGALAIRLALDMPGRVRKLVLMAPGGLEDRETYMGMRGIRKMAKVFFDENGITRESLKSLLSLQLYDASNVSDETIDERLAVAQEQPKEVISTMRVDNLAPELSQLECPVLAFWGVDDVFCPVSGAMRIAQACKNSKTVLLSECGHWVMVEHRELFNRECIEFLRGD